MGLLGPGARLWRLLDDLASDGIRPAAADLAKLHGPAGLGIGAEGPLEIAWSILTEVMAIRNEGAGGFRGTRVRAGEVP